MATTLNTKGMTNMNHFRNLYNYAYNLTLDNAKHTADGYQLDINDLDESELGQFANLFLEYDDRDTVECYNDSEKYSFDDDITCALLLMLKENTYDNKENFASLVRENTIKRYKIRMQDMLNECCREIDPDWRMFA